MPPTPPPALREAFEGIMQGRKQDARTVRAWTKENPAGRTFGRGRHLCPRHERWFLEVTDRERMKMWMVEESRQR